MDGFPLLAMLALATLGIAIVVSMISKKHTKERKRDPNAPKSSLAKDHPDRPLR